MSVTIDLGDLVTFKANVDEMSGYLYDQYEYFGEEAIIKLREILKNIPEVSISNYVYFILNNNDKAAIVDREMMIGCFEIYHRLEDKNYFEYLIVNLYRFWTLLSPALYSISTIDPDVKWDIFLHIPYQLLPISYLNNKLFLDEWLSLNKNKEIILNEIQRFIYQDEERGEKEIKYSSVDTIVQTIQNKEVQKEIMVHNPLNEPEFIPEVITAFIIDETTVNGKKEGRYITDRPSWPGITENIFINDIQNGPVIQIPKPNEGTDIITKSYVLDGYREGITRIYHDGRLFEEEEYHDGINNGVTRYYNEKGEIANESLFAYNNLVEEKQYYPDGSYAERFLNPDTDTDTHVNYYDADNHLLWTIQYGEENELAKPAKQTFFDMNGNVIDEKTYPAIMWYDIQNQTWTEM